MLKHFIKKTLERGAILSGAACIARRRRRGETLILAYHNIVPAGEHIVGDRSLHLPQRQFARQLDAVLETHDIVSLQEVPQEETRSPSSRPRVAITFDDAYRGAVWAGVEELRKRNLPATIFVAPAFLDGGSFWWDALATPTDEGLAPEVRTHALMQERGFTPQVLQWAASAGLSVHAMPPHATCASLSELHTALDHQKLTLGAHTWNHPNLVTLTSDELAFEMREPLDWLTQFGDRAVPHITYPYGHNDAKVQAAARQAQYGAGYLIEGGWVPAGLDSPYTIPRLNIPAGVSDDGFMLRASGLLS